MLDSKYDPRYHDSAKRAIENHSIDKTNPSLPWRIKYKGSYVKGTNGNMMWAKKGHAKLALNNLLRYVYIPGLSYGQGGPRPKGKELADHLIEEGLVEIVQE